MTRRFKRDRGVGCLAAGLSLLFGGGVGADPPHHHDVDSILRRIASTSPEERGEALKEIAAWHVGALAALMLPPDGDANKREYALDFAVLAVPRLRELLSSSDAGIRKAAAAALRAAPGLDRNSLTGVAPLLDAPDAEVRGAVASMVENVAADVGIPDSDVVGWVRDLAPLLSDPDFSVVEQGIGALFRLGPASTSVLFAGFLIGSDKVSEKCVGALLERHLSPEQVMQAADRALSARSPRRVAATTLLASAELPGDIPPIDAKRAVQVLRSCLRDSDMDTRQHAIRALGQFGERASASLPELALFLSSDSNALRKRALDAISAIGPTSDLLDAVFGRLSDSDTYIRWAASRVLPRFGCAARRILPDFRKAQAAERNNRVREGMREAIEAIEKFGGG